MAQHDDPGYHQAPGTISSCRTAPLFPSTRLGWSGFCACAYFIGSSFIADYVFGLACVLSYPWNRPRPEAIYAMVFAGTDRSSSYTRSFRWSHRVMPTN